MILALRRLRWQAEEFAASVSYAVRPKSKTLATSHGPDSQVARY